MADAKKRICDVPGCGKEFSMINEKDPGRPVLAGAFGGARVTMKPDDKGELKETFEQVRGDICPECWAVIFKFVDTLHQEK